MKRTLTLGLCLSLAAAWHAPMALASADTITSGAYRVHLSDALDISFPFASEFNQSVIVQPDGRIALKEVQSVDALGATLPELEQKIAERYRGTLKEPEVSVVLKDFQRPSYYASGEVGKPGRYDLRARTTLLQAIAEAGGFLNDRAKKSQIILLRPQLNGTYETRLIDAKAVLNAKGPVEDYAIQAGDILYVPQNRYSKIARYIPNPSFGAYLPTF